MKKIVEYYIIFIYCSSLIATSVDLATNNIIDIGDLFVFIFSIISFGLYYLYLKYKKIFLLYILIFSFFLQSFSINNQSISFEFLIGLDFRIIVENGLDSIVNFEFNFFNFKIPFYEPNKSKIAMFSINIFHFVVFYYFTKQIKIKKLN